MTLQERLRGCGHFRFSHPHFSGVSDTCDEAADRIDALERELRQHKAAAPLCEKHKPTGGARSMCLICAGESLSAALSRISYACQPPNEYECSDYDVHCSETAVVHQVRDKIDALERENAALRKDAERWRFWKAQAKEQLLDLRRAQSEIAPDMRTHWVGPVLICSGPVGGHMTPDAAIDAAMAQTAN